MAITNAQQARQLYKNGKRVGLFRGAQADAEAGRGDMSPGTDRDGGQRNNDGNNPRRGGAGPNINPKSTKPTEPPGGGTKTKTDIDRTKLAEQNRLEKERVEKARIAKELFEARAKAKKLSDLSKSKTTKFGTPITKPKITKSNFKNPNIFERYLSNNLITKGIDKLTNSDLAYGLNSIHREKYLDDLQEKDPARYAEILGDLQSLGYADKTTKPGTKTTFTDLGEPQAKAILEGGRKVNIDPNDPDGNTYDLSTDYTDTFNTTDNTGGGGDGITSSTIIPTKIPIAENVEEEVVPLRNFGGLSPRIMGSIFNFDGLADGGRAGFKDGEGIMQMASAPDPMDERNMVMETIAMEEFGKPLSDLSEDEIIQIELFMEEMSKRKNEPRFMAQQSGIARAGAMDGGRMMMMANQEEEDDPEGGIMDLESGRQMYFLGKLVKKAAKAVKKVVKSPVGKAALLYFGGNALAGKMGGFGGLKGKFFGLPKQMIAGPVKGLLGTGSSGTMGILGKLGLTKGAGSYMPTAFGGILGTSLLTGALTPKEEDDDSAYKKYMEDMRLDIPALRGRRNLAAAFDGGTYNYEAYANGGRTGYQEGSEEPVAKKTMPLLDMNGQEMDLREEGGFVPLGRMERADDVPARLSKNEFVFTADAVRNAGEGDIDKGAEVMYNMMKNLESGGEVSEESQGLEGAREMFQTSQRLEEVI